MLDTKHLKEQGSHWSWGQSCPLLWAVTDVHDGPRASRTAAISVSYLPRESPTTCSLTRSSLKLALFAANSFSFFKVKSNFYNIHINKGNNMVLDKTSPYSLTAEISPKDFKFTGKKKKLKEMLIMKNYLRISNSALNQLILKLHFPPYLPGQESLSLSGFSLRPCTGPQLDLELAAWVCSWELARSSQTTQNMPKPQFPVL